MRNKIFASLRNLFYSAAFARCNAVADDKATPVARVLGGSNVDLYGQADSAHNLVQSKILPLTNGTRRIHSYYGETAPGTSYANAPIGSEFLQVTQSGGAITASALWLKISSTVWSKVWDTALSGAGGSAETGFTANEFTDGSTHRTIITVDSTLPAIAGGANLAVGKLAYTFPAGEIVVKRAYMSMAITQSEAHITADTPDVGIGTVIGSGAVAVLGGTGTFENILTGQTAADCDGTATVKTVADQILVIATAGAHTVHFNAADGWAASGDAAAAIAGTIILDWEKMNA